MALRYFSIHGIKIVITNDISLLDEYITSTLQSFVKEKQSTDNPDIIVNVSRKKGATLIAEEDKNQYVKIARNLYLGNNFLIWTPEPWFEYKLTLEENKVVIKTLIGDDNLSFNTKNNLKYLYNIVYRADLALERYAYIMRFLIHFPLFWLLRKNKNIELMHASAIAKNNKAMILAGFDGVGKSTLAAYLCTRKGFTFLTDNFLVFDSKYVYSFPELIRLDSNSFGICKKLLKEKRKCFYICGRKHLSLEPRTTKKLPCKVICFNLVGARDVIEEANKKDVENMVMAMSAYLPEFIDYNKFLSMMSLVYPSTLKWNKQKILRKLLNGKKILVIKRNRIENMNILGDELDAILQHS